MPINDLFTRLRRAMAFKVARASCSRWGRQLQFARQADDGRDGLVDQLIQTRDAKRVEHGGDFRSARADVAADEFVLLFQGGQGLAVRHGCSWRED